MPPFLYIRTLPPFFIILKSAPVILPNGAATSSFFWPPIKAPLAAYLGYLRFVPSARFIRPRAFAEARSVKPSFLPALIFFFRVDAFGAAIICILRPLFFRRPPASAPYALTTGPAYRPSSRL